jgi:integrase
MGKHTGFRVVQEGGRWRGFYRHGRKYRSQSWDTEDQAAAWAMARAAEQLAPGQAPAGIRLPVARPSAITTELTKTYLKAMDTKRRALSHQSNVKHTLGMLAEAVPDLAAQDAHRLIDDWMERLQIERVGRHKRKKRQAPSPGYRNRVIAEVRAFCRWLVKKEYLTEDPSRLLERASVDRPIKDQFSVDEVRQLCAPCADHPRQRRVALMLLAGLRSDEAAALTWADISGGMIYIRKHTGFRLKRGRERIVPVQAALAVILGEPGDTADPVAPLRGINSTTQHGRHFRLFLASCGIPVGKRTPHSCRHTYGALMTATGVPSILLQAYMGHRSVATTSDYARAAPLHVAAVAGWTMGTLLVG